MENLWQDIKYGFRMLLKSPAFTAVTVFTLALGIGANTAVFRVINGFFLRPIPGKDNARLWSLPHTVLVRTTYICFPIRITRSIACAPVRFPT